MDWPPLLARLEEDQLFSPDFVQGPLQPLRTPKTHVHKTNAAKVATFQKATLEPIALLQAAGSTCLVEMEKCWEIGLYGAQQL